MVEVDELSTWCDAFLGSRPREELFRAGHLSEVIGVVLDDGREVVIKIRTPSARVEAAAQVQRQLHAAGFPCPEILGGPEPLGPLLATAETYVARHGPAPDPPPPVPTADLLAALVEASPSPDAFEGLNPAPPWVGWDHAGAGVWPWPDDLDIDMNAHPGPDWLDDVARRIRDRLSVATSAAVIGHIDWEAHNLDWDGDRPVLVHDWDSLAVRPEATIAGAAAAVYPSNGTTAVAATIEQTAEFLDAYGRARQANWSRSAEETAWCAGLWVIAYNAKKETLGGGAGYVSHLSRELRERSQRAGI